VRSLEGATAVASGSYHSLVLATASPRGESAATSLDTLPATGSDAGAPLSTTVSVGASLVIFGLATRRGRWPRLPVVGASKEA
jgi:hypothetical protein